MYKLLPVIGVSFSCLKSTVSFSLEPRIPKPSSWRSTSGLFPATSCLDNHSFVFSPTHLPQVYVRRLFCFVTISVYCWRGAFSFFLSVLLLLTSFRLSSLVKQSVPHWPALRGFVFSLLLFSPPPPRGGVSVSAPAAAFPRTTAFLQSLYPRQTVFWRFSSTEVVPEQISSFFLHFHLFRFFARDTLCSAPAKPLRETVRPLHSILLAAFPLLLPRWHVPLFPPSLSPEGTFHASVLPSAFQSQETGQTRSRVYYAEQIVA